MKTKTSGDGWEGWIGWRTWLVQWWKEGDEVEKWRNKTVEEEMVALQAALVGKDIGTIETRSDWFQSKLESRCSAHIPPTPDTSHFICFRRHFYRSHLSCIHLFQIFLLTYVILIEALLYQHLSPLWISLRSSLLCRACLMWRWKCRRGRRTDLRCCCGPRRVRFVLLKPWSEVIAVTWINMEVVVLSSHKVVFWGRGFTMALRDILHMAMDWYCSVCVASRGVLSVLYCKMKQTSVLFLRHFTADRNMMILTKMSTDICRMAWCVAP